MSASVSVQVKPPSYEPPPKASPPPERSREDVSRAAGDRAKKSADLVLAAAKAERAHNTGVGTVVDVTA